jgi:hypothetical protein
VHRSWAAFNRAQGAGSEGNSDFTTTVNTYFMIMLLFILEKELKAAAQDVSRALKLIKDNMVRSHQIHLCVLTVLN